MPEESKVLVQQHCVPFDVRSHLDTSDARNGRLEGPGRQRESLEIVRTVTPCRTWPGSADALLRAEWQLKFRFPESFRRKPAFAI